jgi:short-subunit dehydrogenase
MNVTDVAEEIIQSIERKKRVAIIDWKYRILVAFWRMIPNWIWLRLPVKN